MHFKSDSSGSDKGFSVTVSAAVNEDTVERLCQECGIVLSEADMTTRLGIARAALQTCEHDFEKAHGFIMGNAEKLRERAAKAREEAAQGAGGVYRHCQSRFTVNFQLGEVAQDGEMLVPVPSIMTEQTEYRRLLGTKIRWCSIKSEQPGVGSWVELSTIGARYDIMVHEPFRPVTQETTRAKHETARLCALICESDNIQLETGDAAVGQTACSAVKECIITALCPQNFGQERALMVSRLSLRDGDVQRLANAMVESGCDSVEVLSVIDDEALRPVVEQVKPPLPLPLVSSRMHRNLLAHLLRSRAEEKMKENVENVSRNMATGGRGSNRRGMATGGGRNLGGWDTLSIANAVSQDAAGHLCWLGRHFKPIASDELPNSGPHGWLSVAFKHLLGSILKELDFNDEPHLYLLEESDDVASTEPSVAPLLMYQCAIGELAIVSQHPGQFWEVYRPHERRPLHFCVDALIVHAGRMHRQTVYTSDSRHTLPEVYGRSRERQTPTPEHQRYARGYMFSPLFDDGNYQTTQTPRPTLSVRRTPGEPANAADKRAIERAGLNDLGGVKEEWAAQELVPSTLLRPLLPHILVETFEFWAAGPSVIWGYPRTDIKLKREAKIKKAQKKGPDAVSKVTTREWYDGIALLIDLVRTPGPPPRRRRRQTLKSAIVHRIAWDGAS